MLYRIEIEHPVYTLISIEFFYLLENISAESLAKNVPGFFHPPSKWQSDLQRESASAKILQCIH